MTHPDKNYDNMENPIGQFLYSWFIKYPRLHQLVQKEFKGVNDREILIFIDLYEFYRPLYNTTNTTNKMDITTCTINLAIHFRNFFKHYGIYAHIFLLYSPTMGPSNLKYIPEYNSARINAMLNNGNISNAINENLNLIGLIVPYLPDIYFKIGTVETSVMAYDIITQLQAKGFKRKSIFVSTSQVAMQLPSVVPDLIIFHKKKNKETKEDESYSVNNSNNMFVLLQEIKHVNVPNMLMKPNWIAPYFCLCGLPQRSIKALYNYKQSLQVMASIEDAYQTITPETLIDAVSRNFEDNRTNLTNLMLRFKCIDLNFQLAEYRTLPESKETAFMRQVNDIEQLWKINEQYFDKSNRMNLAGL